MKKIILQFANHYKRAFCEVFIHAKENQVECNLKCHHCIYGYTCSDENFSFNQRLFKYK